MKRILLPILLLNIYTISFSSAAPASASNPNAQAPEKKCTCVGTPALKKLTALISYPPSYSALHPQFASYAFGSKEEAIKAGWRFKKGDFNRAEVVLRPIESQVNIRQQGEGIGKTPLWETRMIYISGISLGMQNDQVIVQNIEVIGNQVKHKPVLFPSDKVGRFPENDMPAEVVDAQENA